MTGQGVHLGNEPVQAVFRERCDALGLPTWRYSAAMQLISAPQESGLIGTWLRSGYIESQVTRVVRAWHESEAPEPVEVIPGMWLLPAVETFRRRRTAYVVSAAMTDEMTGSDQFLAACDSAELDSAAMRKFFGGRAMFTRESIERLRRVLEWMARDLDVIAQQNKDLESFGKQLSESYEQISLLYELGRSLNQLAHPEKFITDACRELFGTMPFKWIAARFSKDDSVLESMADRLFWCGELPSGESGLDACTARVVAEVSETSERIVTAADLGLEGGRGVVLMHPILHDGRAVGVLFAGDKQGDDRQISNADIRLLETTAGFFDVLLENAALYEDQRRNFLGTLEALTSAIDAKDPYTSGHSERVAALACELAKAHGLGEEEAQRIRIGGLVHDIGKIGVAESVLCKAGRLTDEEFEQIKRHPKIGYDILKDIPSLADVLPGVLWHHERWDGRGYPDGRPMGELPLIARIIGLVDAFDAMSSNRTYRAAMDRAKVLGEIERNAGTQFDPSLVKTFLTMDLQFFDDLLADHRRRTAA